MRMRMRCFSAIVMSESEAISPYVQRLQDLHDLLERLGEPVTEAKKASNLLNSLNSKYFAMIDIIQMWAITAPNLYNIQTILSTLLGATSELRSMRENVAIPPTLCHNGAAENTVRLRALHVPSLGQTLVSLSCINKQG